MKSLNGGIGMDDAAVKSSVRGLRGIANFALTSSLDLLIDTYQAMFSSVDHSTRRQHQEMAWS